MISFNSTVKCHWDKDRICENSMFCGMCEYQPADDDKPNGRKDPVPIRWGKRANFADRLKSDVQYDLLCLAETTSSGYMTHGNVKLCGECMNKLLMWLDADDFCSYGEKGER